MDAPWNTAMYKSIYNQVLFVTSAQSRFLESIASNSTRTMFTTGGYGWPRGFADGIVGEQMAPGVAVGIVRSRMAMGQFCRESHGL
jgi:hypothetical protein